MMTLILTVMVFLLSVILVLAIGSIIFYRRHQVSDRLSVIQRMTEEADVEEILNLPFMQRVIVPALSSMGHTLGNLAPLEIRTKMEQKILYAGTPGNLTFAGLVAVQVLLAGSFLMLAILLFRFMQVDAVRMFFIQPAGCSVRVFPSDRGNQ
jgi:hypothetical protein